MFDFHEKRKLRRLIYSKVTIGVVLILCLLLAVSAFKRFEKEREIAAKRAEAEAELATLVEQAKNLEADIARLRNDRGLETEIRDRFDVVKPGEQAVIIIDDLPNSVQLPYSE